MEQSNPKDLVPKFFANTASTYDSIVYWGTLGKDKYWKAQIIASLPQADSFLDLACGTGILTRQIAKLCPDARIVGVDITRSYLDVAKQNSQYENISYVLQDVETMNIGSKFDCIVSSYIPKYCNPGVLVKKCLEHLNPGGTIILHDFTYPKNILVRSLWNVYMTLLRLVGIAVPSWSDALRDLPKLIRSTNWAEDCQVQLKQANFDIRCKFLTLGGSAIIVASKS